MDSYNDLTVYRRSKEAVLTVYREIAPKMPKEEVFGLTSQIKRASVSIPLNIAEGYARRMGWKEIQRFLSMAMGSSAEVVTITEIIYELGYIDRQTYEKVKNEYDQIGRMINGLIKSLESDGR